MGQQQQSPAPAPAQTGDVSASPTQAPAPAPEAGGAPPGAPARTNDTLLPPLDGSAAPTIADLQTGVSNAADGTAAMNLVAEFARRGGDLPALRTNGIALGTIMGKVGADNAPRSCQFIHLDLKWSIFSCRIAGGLTDTGWGMIVQGKTAQDCVDALTWPDNLQHVMERLSGDPVDAFPPLSADPFALKTVLDAHPEFGRWIVRRSGEERLSQVMAFINIADMCATLRTILVSAGAYDAWISGLPSPITDDGQKRMVYYMFLSEPDAAKCMLLFQKRFAINLTTRTGTAADGSTITPTWNNKDSLTRLWLVCDRLPPGDVAATNRIIREAEGAVSNGQLDTDPTVSGWGGGGDIGANWADSANGSNEVGAYTDDTDPMRGLNIFNATMRHEFGHNVGDATNFDKPGGFVFTQFGWQKHQTRAELSAMFNAFLGVAGMPLTAQPEDQRQPIRDRVIAALSTGLAGNSTKPSAAAYQTLIGAADWAIVQNEPFINYISFRGDESSYAWDNASAVGGRSYHVAYDWYGWTSVGMDQYPIKPSNYAMRCALEWFAECYATYYADADMPGGHVGSLLRGRNAPAADAFDTRVNGRYDIAHQTGQSTAMPHGNPLPVGDFPAPRPPAGDGSALA